MSGNYRMGTSNWHESLKQERQRIEIESDFMFHLYRDIILDNIKHQATTPSAEPEDSSHLEVVPRKHLKVVEKALEIPVVMSAYAGFNNIVNRAVEKVTAAVDKIDTLACEGIDQLTEKVPVLKEPTPEFLESSKDTASSYVTAAADYMTSFSVVKSALKIAESGLDNLEEAVKFTGDKLSNTTNIIQSSSSDTKPAATRDKAKKASVVGALAEVTGLSLILDALGLGSSKDDEEGIDENEVVDEETELKRETSVNQLSTRSRLSKSILPVARLFERMLPNFTYGA